MQRCIEENHEAEQGRSPTQELATIKRARTNSDDRGAGYQEAREAFEVAEPVRQVRERLGVTQAELAARSAAPGRRSPVSKPGGRRAW